VLSRYKKILSYARKFEGLFNWDLCYCQLQGSGFNPDRHFAFLRYGPKGAWLVFCNFSDEPASVNIIIPEELKRHISALVKGGNANVIRKTDAPIAISAKAWDSTII